MSTVPLSEDAILADLVATSSTVFSLVEDDNLLAKLTELRLPTKLPQSNEELFAEFKDLPLENLHKELKATEEEQTKTVSSVFDSSYQASRNFLEFNVWLDSTKATLAYLNTHLSSTKDHLHDFIRQNSV